MDTRWRWVLLTAVAPIAWGSTYYVTRHFLPADAPLWGAVLRALPAGLVLLVFVRRLPRGAWWWRAAVLGVCNMGAFFALVYLAAQLLPTSIASMIMATSPVVMMIAARFLLAQRLRALPLVGAALGVAGVALMLLGAGSPVDGRGVAASVAAMTMSSLGFVLARRWGGDVDVPSMTAWQLTAGGLALLPFALVVEGAPPAVDAAGAAAYAYLALVATAIAYLAWFTGLAHLPAGAVGLIGLLNPVTGVVLGTALAGEALGWRQAAGIALVFAGILLGQPIAQAAARAIRRSRARR